MRPLVIGPELKARIAAVVEKATQNPIRHETMKLAAQGVVNLAESWNQQFHVDLGFGYRAVYTHEEQKPGVVCRHFSVSIPRADATPNPIAVQMLLGEFGFVNPLQKAVVWLEDFPDGGKAVNVVEPLDGDMSKLAVKP